MKKKAHFVITPPSASGALGVRGGFVQKVRTLLGIFKLIFFEMSMDLGIIEFRPPVAGIKVFEFP